MSDVMGAILTLILVVGDYDVMHPQRTSVAVSHQRFATLEACKAAGETAKAHTGQITPHAKSYGARIIYFCSAEGRP